MLLRFIALAAVIVPAMPALSQDRLAVFDEAVAVVQSQFYDPGMSGTHWDELVRDYRSRVENDMDRAAFAAVINELLAHLNASHTTYLTRDVPAWYQLAGIFLDGYPPLQQALEPFLSNGAPVYTGIGVMLEPRPEGIFVSGVLDGFPAESAGVLVGDRLVSVEDAPYHPIRSFAGRDGLPTTLAVERAPGATMRLTVVPTLLDGRTMFEGAMAASARLIESGGKAIGYIRAWSYAGQKYQDILTRTLTNGVLKDADALVLDLRGGWGGASPSYLNFFVEQSVEAQSIGRDGTVHTFESGWSRPTVLLVDDRSGSGKELFAYGFRALGKGIIVGERTAGDVLAGKINALTDGSLLYVAVADVRVAGQRLEDRGVMPDVVVPFDPAYAGGADPQLRRAVEIAAERSRSRRIRVGGTSDLETSGTTGEAGT